MQFDFLGDALSWGSAFFRLPKVRGWAFDFEINGI